MQRVTFTDNTVNVLGWPSRGGLIVLEEATHVDFQFLGISTTSPPLTQVESNASRPTMLAHAGNHGQEQDDDESDEREDVFCRQLLLLGAKWFDSWKRCRFTNGYGAGLQPYIEDVEQGRKEQPTMRERRWVKVGWESFNGGFWILECDTNWMGIIEPDNLVPVDWGRLILATTKAERCEILRGLGAKHYPNLAAYESRSTFLRAFEWKTEGEVGVLKRDEHLP